MWLIELYWNDLGGVKIDERIRPGMLMLGYRYLDNSDPSYERTIWQVSGIVELRGDLFRIGRGTSICVTGTCSFGNRFMISGKSSIICNKSVRFGNDVLLSWDVLIMDTDYHDIHDESGARINKDKPIEVGDKVWIGCRSLILKGSYIPSNSVIAAGSTISGMLERENCIYSSNGKILKNNICWKI